MIIDTSAFIALLQAEPEAARFAATIGKSAVRRIDSLEPLLFKGDDFSKTDVANALAQKPSKR